MSSKPGTDSLSLFPGSNNISGRANPEIKPHFELEELLRARGAKHIAGVDEAGRGPLAGPVVAAAVILDPKAIPGGLNDSKKLTEKRREALFADITSSALAIAWHSASPSRIDEINILQASLEAMARSINGLAITVQGALFDGRDVPLPCRQFGQAVIKGDATSLSIAAASIVAKVIRDRIMIRAAEIWPQYGFEGHKGYGSAKHLAAIRELGPCPLHRRSFSPMKEMQR